MISISLVPCLAPTPVASLSVIAVGLFMAGVCAVRCTLIDIYKQHGEERNYVYMILVYTKHLSEDVEAHSISFTSQGPSIYTTYATAEGPCTKKYRLED